MLCEATRPCIMVSTQNQPCIPFDAITCTGSILHNFIKLNCVMLYQDQGENYKLRLVIVICSKYNAMHVSNFRRNL